MKKTICGKKEKYILKKVCCIAWVVVCGNLAELCGNGFYNSIINRIICLWVSIILLMLLLMCIYR